MQARAELRRRSAPAWLEARPRSLDRARGLAPARLLAAAAARAGAEVVRYERERPGELLHVDVKKLGRIIAPGHRVTADRSTAAHGKAGWLFVFAAVDDATRLGFARVYPDETTASALAFLPDRVSRGPRARMLSWGEEILRCHVETEEVPRGADRAWCAAGA